MLGCSTCEIVLETVAVKVAKSLWLYRASIYMLFKSHRESNAKSSQQLYSQYNYTFCAKNKCSYLVVA